MGKVLVVYYSRSGNTKKVGDLIAKYLNADVEEIVDTKKRKGIIGFILSGRDAMKELETKLQDTTYNPCDYDHIIIGTPVWASKICSPVLTYIKKNTSNLSNVSLFFTQGGASRNKISEQMNKLVKNKPINTLSIYGEDFRSGIYMAKIDDFINKNKHP